MHVDVLAMSRDSKGAETRDIPIDFLQTFQETVAELQMRQEHCMAELLAISYLAL